MLFLVLHPIFVQLFYRFLSCFFLSPSSSLYTFFLFYSTFCSSLPQLSFLRYHLFTLYPTLPLYYVHLFPHNYFNFFYLNSFHIKLSLTINISTSYCSFLSLLIKLIFFCQFSFTILCRLLSSQFFYDASSLPYNYLFPYILLIYSFFSNTCFYFAHLFFVFFAHLSFRMHNRFILLPKFFIFHNYLFLFLLSSLTRFSFYLMYQYVFPPLFLQSPFSFSSSSG